MQTLLVFSWLPVPRWDWVSWSLLSGSHVVVSQLPVLEQAQSQAFLVCDTWKFLDRPTELDLASGSTEPRSWLGGLLNGRFSQPAFLTPSTASTWPCLSHSASPSRTCPNFAGRSTRSCVTANSLCERRIPGLKPIGQWAWGCGGPFLPEKLQFLSCLSPSSQFPMVFHI